MLKGHNSCNHGNRGTEKDKELVLQRKGYNVINKLVHRLFLRLICIQCVVN